MAAIAYKVDFPKDSLYTRVMAGQEPDRSEIVEIMLEHVRDYIERNLIKMWLDERGAVQYAGVSQSVEETGRDSVK